MDMSNVNAAKRIATCGPVTPDVRNRRGSAVGFAGLFGQSMDGLTRSLKWLISPEKAYTVKCCTSNGLPI